MSPPAAQWSCSRVSEAGHPDNLAQIEDFIEALNARLVVLDPLLSYIGVGVNEYRDKEVRRALMPLIALAQRRSVALVCLRHVTKAIIGSAKHRVRDDRRAERVGADRGDGRTGTPPG